jgi:Spy/CpxP family protein refolding chaperone
MARQTTWVLAVFVLCASTATAAATDRGEQARPASVQGASKDNKDKSPASAVKPDDRERLKWWLYDRAELAITDQQSRDIDQIWESTIPKLRESRHELDRAEEELSRTIKEHKADLAAVSGLLDRVESARSQHNKTRTLMLYRMHLLLNAEQRTRLAALRARQEAGRKDAPRRHP